MSAMAAGYRRWRGEATGVWSRRFAIASCGIRLCLSSKLLKAILILCWGVGLIMAGLFFLAGQILVVDSPVLAYLTEPFGARAKQMIDAMVSLVMLYPDIVVDGFYRIVFTLASIGLQGGAMLMTSFFVSKLMTQDMACQAILIYRSKALTRFDYALGKFAVAFTILGFGWLGPIVAGYAFGNLLSPSLTFLVHSFDAFVRAVVLGLIGVTAISLVALAVSAFSRKTAAAVGLWMMVWIVAGIFGSALSLVVDWGSLLSLSNLLQRLIWQVFDLPGALERMQEMMPFVFKFLDFKVPANESKAVMGGIGIPGLLISLAIYAGLAVALISRRTRVE